MSQREWDDAHLINAAYDIHRDDPELARRMLQRAIDAGVPAGWLTADEVYGQDKRLRVWWEQHGLPYVLAPAPTKPWPPSTGANAGSAR